jgi:hypothetical protein
LARCEPGQRDVPGTPAFHGICDRLRQPHNRAAMNAFWASFFTYLRDCGRNTHLFMLTLAGVFLLVVVGTLIVGNNLQGYVLGALPPAGIFLLVWAGVAFTRARARSMQRLGSAPLSYDELHKARSKLVRNRKASS